MDFPPGIDAVDKQFLNEKEFKEHYSFLRAFIKVNIRGCFSSNQEITEKTTAKELCIPITESLCYTAEINTTL